MDFLLCCSALASSMQCKHISTHYDLVRLQGGACDGTAPEARLMCLRYVQVDLVSDAAKQAEELDLVQQKKEEGIEIAVGDLQALEAALTETNAVNQDLLHYQR